MEIQHSFIKLKKKYVGPSHPWVLHNASSGSEAEKVTGKPLGRLSSTSVLPCCHNLSWPLVVLHSGYLHWKTIGSPKCMGEESHMGKLKERTKNRKHQDKSLTAYESGSVTRLDAILNFPTWYFLAMYFGDWSMIFSLCYRRSRIWSKDHDSKAERMISLSWGPFYMDPQNLMYP